MSEVRFQIWGCRGGRNARGSRIGNRTSCYSLCSGGELFVFDAGRGLATLADAVLDGELREITRIHVLVTHAHVDHWEGLKDAAWMWAPRNGRELVVCGPREALAAIENGLAPPAFVPLDVLAIGTLAKLSYVELAAGARIALPGATLHAAALHHYSGVAPDRRYLETLGYQLVLDSGPRVAYLSDHEPTAATRAAEDELIARSDLVLVDATYGACAEHAFGHGSIEYASDVARRHPHVTVLAGHHGPLRSDAMLMEALRTYASGCPNLRLATEGSEVRWDAAAGRFMPA